MDSAVFAPAECPRKSRLKLAIDICADIGGKNSSERWWEYLDRYGVLVCRPFFGRTMLAAGEIKFSFIPPAFQKVFLQRLQSPLQIPDHLLCDLPLLTFSYLPDCRGSRRRCRSLDPFTHESL